MVTAVNCRRIERRLSAAAVLVVELLLFGELTARFLHWPKKLPYQVQTMVDFQTVPVMSSLTQCKEEEVRNRRKKTVNYHKHKLYFFFSIPLALQKSEREFWRIDKHSSSKRSGGIMKRKGEV